MDENSHEINKIISILLTLLLFCSPLCAKVAAAPSANNFQYMNVRIDYLNGRYIAYSFEDSITKDSTICYDLLLDHKLRNFIRKSKITNYRISAQLIEINEVDAMVTINKINGRDWYGAICGAGILYVENMRAYNRNEKTQ
ncbi:hypothetical protein U1839_02195 [Sphingomonas sp. RT2P30]|uniref:hypothetical protein n=1 Tax=Parasphingomonas halimpatiens TaxID=3096162 RepID=UPI002FC6368C